MSEKSGYHIRVVGGESPLRLNLKDVWRYRDLIWLFTKRTFILYYKQTILGPLWVILTPLLTSVIYTVVFGELAGLSTAGVPKFLFYLCSHSLWVFFSDCLTKNASAFTVNANVFSKVYFPRLTIPISTMFSAFIQFLIQMAMVGCVILWHVARGELHPVWKLLPFVLPALLLTGLLGLGMGILISSVTTKYRDLTFLVGFGVQLWMYASPVIYPVSQLSGGVFYDLLILNPMTAPMELFRLALLGTGDVLMPSVLSTIVFTVVVFLGGVLIFNKVERDFIDTV